MRLESAVEPTRSSPCCGAVRRKLPDAGAQFLTAQLQPKAGASQVYRQPCEIAHAQSAVDLGHTGDAEIDYLQAARHDRSSHTSSSLDHAGWARTLAVYRPPLWNCVMLGAGGLGNFLTDARYSSTCLSTGPEIHPNKPATTRSSCGSISILYPLG